MQTQTVNKSDANIILRLDDGQIIGRSQVLSKQLNIPEGQAVKLSVPDLFSLGRVGDRESVRTQNILNELNSRQLENLNNIKSSKKSNKKQKPNQQAQNIVQQQETQKKQHQKQQQNQAQKVAKQKQSSEIFKESNIQSHTNGQIVNKDDPEYQAMIAKFNQILNKVLANLGKYRDIFDQPVDPNAYPQYYEKIKKPMDLSTMKKKLDVGVYQNPQQFRDDMMLIWMNCKIFNNEGDFVHSLGEKNETFFDQLWVQQGFGEARQSLQGSRSKRLNAGQHSQKFDPTDFEETVVTPPAKQKSIKEKPTKTKQTSQKVENDVSKDKQNSQIPQQQQQQYHQQQQQMPMQQPQQYPKPQDQQQIKIYNEQLQQLTQQFQSLKAITDHPNIQQQQQQLMDINKQMQIVHQKLEKEIILAQRGFMDPTLKNFIANVINEGNVGDEVMEGALSVIQAGVSIDGGDDGLIEVEIDQIDDATLWKLHDYLRSSNVLGGNQNAPPQIPQPQQQSQPQPQPQHMQQ